MVDGLISIMIVGLLLGSLGVMLYLEKKRVSIWIRHYLKRLLKNSSKVNGPIDIMLLFVDHFELNGHADRLHAWDKRYPELASRHKDSDGEYPKHTFFYAMDLMHEHELKSLEHLVEEGFGEFELHWHHSHDTPESFVEQIRDAMKIFHRYGFMKPYKKGQEACFSFIHGNWSLDNSGGIECCGVDNEIELLIQEGCYGDFTFPALFSDAQPPTTNNIYYCIDDGKPKSYEKGRESVVGVTPKSEEFMIFQGPLTINWTDWRHKWHPTIEDGDINHIPTQGDPKRIDAWVRQAIHVEGKPEWQFVKIFCHGAQDHQSVVGPATDKMFSYFESKYNDGKKYRLHYVTAREAYNIVRAAEDGKSGNPNGYRDYKIPHPLKR
ncbi:MAG: hypothetical protein JKY67_19515 [Pseudomonadales bacterium]|nr:hypothetical protein [Pseudomonadales bacterium]